MSRDRSRSGHGEEAAAPAAPRLRARELTLAYDQGHGGQRRGGQGRGPDGRGRGRARVAPVVEGLDLDIPDGRVTVIVGPNACGKSTTLRALGRLLRPRHGTVLLDGQELARLPTRQIARTLGLLPQSPTAPEAITVADLVARGRQPHQRWWQQWSTRDERAVTDAMARTDVAALADRPVDELSGGQRQRVWLAMALAQETDVLLLDEPTTFLDIAHQVEVLNLVRRLVTDPASATDQEGGAARTVVLVLHDLNQAARYADHLVAMRDGAIVAQGPPGEVVTARLVEEVFGLEAVVVPDPVTGSPLVVPSGPVPTATPGGAGGGGVAGTAETSDASDTTSSADTTSSTGSTGSTGSASTAGTFRKAPLT
ncbi:ABC transporter ATP-binding protein [Streptomyces sp. 4N509B]|uniref:ABC transporter ATP-binding protein n=1 Tax=Streptomyces sp. 4N509B TaxID=3457413 RepID=UPI003FD06F33